MNKIRNIPYKENTCLNLLLYQNVIKVKHQEVKVDNLLVEEGLIYKKDYQPHNKLYQCKENDPSMKDYYYNLTYKNIGDKLGALIAIMDKG